MPQQLLQGYQARPLLFWLAGSLLIYALAANAAWLAKRALEKRGRRLPLWARWLAEVCALLFFVGVPYLALGGWPLAPFTGLLSLADVGLVGVGADWPAARWLEAAGTGLALGLAGLAVLATAWWLAHRGGAAFHLPVRSGAHVLVHGLYCQVHWSFYRAALAVTLADAYAGIWCGLALVLLEWTTNPAWRAAWRDPLRAGTPWLGAGLALLSTLLFLLTRNLWICIAVHWLVAGTLTTVAPTPSAVIASASKQSPPQK